MDQAGAGFGGSLILKTLLENPDLLKAPEPNEDKKNKGESGIYDASAAFLGPTLWDKTIPFDGDDFKFEYMDLDEFLHENGLNNNEQLKGFNGLDTYDMLDASSLDDSTGISSPPRLLLDQTPSPQSSLHSSPRPVVEDDKPVETQLQQQTPIQSPHVSPARSESPDYDIQAHDLALATVPGSWTPPHQPEDIHLDCQDFDPRRRHFSPDELKPQPMVKKSRKIFVPEDLKDDKYWSRRKKNNIAAKRSRDARRIKENQIVLRAQFLEKENSGLKSQLEKFRKENASLKVRLAKYEG
ncbi:thyrotroph embryonic factor-like [Tubulanus polymorphus]|uniref:thyrotroph embryonic factor-like n=1 Tax=Tubulanus polymorphus TaxID=672921 RepID=UPI003DA445A6